MSQAEHGFTLIETLVALALVGVALLLGMALVLSQPRMLKRLESERQAFRAIEGTLEAIRGGSIPLAPAHFENFAFSAGTPAARDLTLSMDISQAAFPPGLYQISLRAHYSVAGQGFDKRVDTLVWQPNPAVGP
jgi:prepilin-type N-terminal cleavage/methylation domain-containing protein